MKALGFTIFAISILAIVVVIGIDIFKLSTGVGILYVAYYVGITLFIIGGAINQQDETGT